jgi:DNA-binding XRE family transcriptional regulator
MTLKDQLRKLCPVDARKIDELFNLLSLDAKDMTSSQLRAAREAAGLSLGQAAKQIGVHRSTIEALEEDQATLSYMKATIAERECPPFNRQLVADMFQKMNHVYGLKTPITEE